jgi:hypothetical protein
MAKGGELGASLIQTVDHAAPGHGIRELQDADVLVTDLRRLVIGNSQPAGLILLGGALTMPVFAADAKDPILGLSTVVASKERKGVLVFADDWIGLANWLSFGRVACRAFEKADTSVDPIEFVLGSNTMPGLRLIERSLSVAVGVKVIAGNEDWSREFRDEIVSTFAVEGDGGSGAPHHGAGKPVDQSTTQFTRMVNQLGQTETVCSLCGETVPEKRNALARHKCPASACQEERVDPDTPSTT